MNMKPRSDVFEILRAKPTYFAPRELSVIRAFCVPDQKGSKEIAADLGLSYSTIKVYISRIYQKLGWFGGTQRMLVLWALAHRDELGINLPTARSVETRGVENHEQSRFAFDDVA